MVQATRYDQIRHTQLALFKDSGIDKDDFAGLIELFSPENLADYLGVSYRVVDVIPSSNPNFEVAGILDRTNKNILVSNIFPIEQRRLTGIHELNHWMLHKHVGRDCLHRDRSITHTPEGNAVEWWEFEATHLACLYLMPEKLVKIKFSELFGLPIGVPLIFDDNTAFYLGRNIEELRGMDDKQKAFTLATTQKYGRDIDSLHKQFKVSSTAMAIRLLELNLIAPDRFRGRPNLHIVP